MKIACLSLKGGDVVTQITNKENLADAMSKFFNKGKGGEVILVGWRMSHGEAVEMREKRFTFKPATLRPQLDQYVENLVFPYDCVAVVARTQELAGVFVIFDVVEHEKQYIPDHGRLIRLV